MLKCSSKYIQFSECRYQNMFLCCDNNPVIIYQSVLHKNIFVCSAFSDQLQKSRVKHYTMDDETARETNNSEVIRSTEQYYDEIVPSWHGEFCDNVPNHLFCQFRKTKMKAKTEDKTGLFTIFI